MILSLPDSTGYSSSYGSSSGNSSLSPGKKGHIIWNGLKDFLSHHQSQTEELDLEAQFPSQRARSKSDATSTGRFGRLSFRRKRHTGALEKQISSDDPSYCGGEPLEEEEEESRDEPRPLFVDTRLANRVSEDGVASPGSSTQPQSYPNAWKPGARHQRSRSNSGGENLLVLRNTSQFYLEILGHLDNPEEVYQQFLRTQSCYDLVPRLAKLVVLDTKLTEMNCVGMLTYTDYLEMLSISNAAGGATEDEISLGDLPKLTDNGTNGGKRRGSLLTLEEWFDNKTSSSSMVLGQSGLLAVDCGTKLLEATRLLIANHCHRVAVLDQDSDNMMCLLSSKAILKLLHRNMYFLPVPTWMKSPLSSEIVGTWDNIITITESAPISEAIDVFLRHKVSSIPVVNEISGQMITILCKSHIMDLLSEILKQNDADNVPRKASSTEKSNGNATNEKGSRVTLTSGDDCFQTNPPGSDLLVNVMEKLATKSFRCVFVIDGEKRPLAAISVSDMMGLIAAEKE